MRSSQSVQQMQFEFTVPKTGAAVSLGDSTTQLPVDFMLPAVRALQI